MHKEYFFVDVGSKNSLEYISIFSKNTVMHAFEPNPIEFEKIKFKYPLNHFKNLNINKVALSNFEGNSSFFISENNSMSSFLEPDLKNYKRNFGHYQLYPVWEKNINTKEKIEVETTTLDKYSKEHNLENIDYLKLDTQGTELDILKGAIELIKNSKISVIKVEVSTIPVYKNQVLFSDIDVFLRGLNYRLIDFITYNVVESSFNNSNKIHSASCGDAIYFLNEDKLDDLRLEKAAEILSWLGYKNYAKDILVERNFPKDLIQSILKIHPITKENLFNKLSKNLLPPIIFNSLKRLLSILN